MQKTSIRFFEDIPVRAVWDEESSKWWFCAMDIAEALTKSKNPRVYWATVKRRNSELIAICKQLKLKAKDGKFYNGFSYANLKNMRQFYKCYQNDEIGYTLCSQLSWSHNRLIMRVTDKAAREYYLREASAQGWSVGRTATGHCLIRL